MLSYESLALLGKGKQWKPEAGNPRWAGMVNPDTWKGLIHGIWLSNMAKTTKNRSKKDRKRHLGKGGKTAHGCYPSSLSYLQRGEFPNQSWCFLFPVILCGFSSFSYLSLNSNFPHPKPPRGMISGKNDPFPFALDLLPARAVCCPMFLIHIFPSSGSVPLFP